MRAGVEVTACGVCGWRGLPERLWCPKCRSDRVRTVLVYDGHVTETSTVRRAVGHRSMAVRIGTVRLVGGGVGIGRLEPGVVSGSRVRLFTDSGAMVARER